MTAAPSSATVASAAAASAKPRSSEGCWTCRLRRKKCDEGRPECQICAVLQIECLYSEAKPDWMDGGEQQRLRAELVKAEVKRKATWRRERRYMLNLEGSLQDLEMTDGPDGTHLMAREHPQQAVQAPRQKQHQHHPPHDHDHHQRQTSVEDDVTAHAPPLPSSQASTAEAETSSYSGGSDHYGSVSGFTHTPASSHESATRGIHDSVPTPPPSADNVALQPMPQLATERELNLAMVYLDYVFPFLFPFYRPPLVQGGRGWLLVLLVNNKALFHASLSLASSLYSSWVLSIDGAGESMCQEHSREELLRQQELGVHELMADIADINAKGVKGRLKESSRVLASIIQILCFELATGNTGSFWTLHLDGAIVLLDQIMSLNATVSSPGGVPCWVSILAQLGEDEKSPPPFLSRKYRMMNAHQSALSFFAATLLHFDIVTSTVLETAPRLAAYHLSLLHSPREIVAALRQNVAAQNPGVDPAALDGMHPVCGTTQRVISEPIVLSDEPAIDLADVCGAANWALLAVADVASLAAWKAQQRALGQLSVPELVLRASQIEKSLRLRIAELDPAVGAGSPRRSTSLFPRPEVRISAAAYERRRPPCDTGAGAYGNNICPVVNQTPQGGIDQDWVTRTWAHAALCHLLVVVNGWQPASVDLRAAVAATLSLLQAGPTPACLRVVGWPFAVAGCLASAEQEEDFRGLARAIEGGLDMFGTVKEALAIMEEVWRRRAEIDGGHCGDWDLARCFGILGHRAFLV